MRIIYKIKSSWDFISSQILIYLKRRWNSKMAISIKNHEDRITALEKKKPTFTYLYQGSKQNNEGVGPITLKQSWKDFDFLFVCSCQGDTKDDWDYRTIPTRSIRPYDYKSYDQPGEVILGLITTETQNIQGYFHTDYKTLYISKSYKTVLRDIIGLKLYYNFSYNITREFYKVKFKLKHYLCSHLQKFI